MRIRRMRRQIWNQTQITRSKLTNPPLLPNWDFVIPVPPPHQLPPPSLLDWPFHPLLFQLDQDETILELSPEDKPDMTQVSTPRARALALDRPKRNIKPKTFYDGTNPRVPEVVKIKQPDGSSCYKLKYDVEPSATMPKLAPKPQVTPFRPPVV